MCGIAGIWHRGGKKPVDKAVLLRMASVLQHRGPDDSGYMIEHNIGLAHRRLAVIDLSAAGHQPMTTPDGRFTLVFNGEIYNYRELAKKYCQGVELKSDCDTEVLLHMLAREGAGALPELRGMFALALWDAREQRLLLARDPFGKKPLYWAVRGDTFLFASEVKSLLLSPWVSREMDAGAAVKYFLYEYVPAPSTGFKDVWQVPMGHCAEVTADSLNVRQWWKPTYQPKHVGISEKQARGMFDTKLAKAVERRMVSDVPVGVLLSGGLDSTCISWYMRQISSAPLHSFSVSFDEASFDESRYARLAARAVGTVHHDVRFTVERFHEALEQVMPVMDIPLGDASLLPTYVVSQLAKSEITVALDGDGSDELLGGYGTFRAAEMAERLPNMAPSVWRRLYAAARLWPTSYRDFSFDFKVKSFLEGMVHDKARRNQVWLGSFAGAELKQLLTDEYREYVPAAFEDVDTMAGRVAGMEVQDAISCLTVHHYLQNDILVKLDRAAMFVSLEARTPFLDVDVAEWLMRLPTEFKRNKRLLKELMRGRIPDEIIDRPKKGFGVPLGFWLKGPLYEWASGVLAEDKLRAGGVVRPEVVLRLLAEHRRGRADHRKKLWTLLAWQMWYDRWVA